MARPGVALARTVFSVSAAFGAAGAKTEPSRVSAEPFTRGRLAENDD
jgi:hypothetical protein